MSLAIVASLVSVASGPASSARALSGSEFDPGYIISDQVFFDKNAMTEAQIQAFLEARLPSCAQSAGVACMKNYTETTHTEPATAKCNEYTGAANEPASRIVFRVAQACGINPQVLLVMLQKEQGLITSGSPSATMYRIAMGYACPDTAACDARYYGFFNQVHSAAWQMKQYTQYPNDRAYRIGNVAVQYNPNPDCGAPVINIRNQATANLYNYTPYQPNAAALANLGGYGDGCSSYGNRNFWVYFSNWFGTPTGPVNPFGYVEAAVAVTGGIRVSGWAIDPSTPDPIPVHFYVDGVGTAVIADASRPDVGAAYPASGPLHGFSAVLPVATAGSHQVCAFGYNVGPGANTLFGCWTVVTQSPSPFGSVDPVVASAGAVTVSGWAIDPNSAGAISVHVYVDDKSVAVLADAPRAEVGTSYPDYGSNHGFSIKLDTPPGPHKVCVWGINVGFGAHSLLSCSTVSVPSAPGSFPELGRAPFGWFDDAVAGPSAITFSGWAIDPDTASPIAVHLYVDNRSVAVKADGRRPDVAAKFSGYGEQHGYIASMDASPGSHSVCAYAINAGPGVHTLLGCKTVVVPAPPGGLSELGRAPIGGLEAVAASASGVSVAGWALDPDTAQSLAIHVYVDSRSVAGSADLDRPDIVQLYPQYGAKHGFSTSVAAAAGSHRVCVYAINAGPGGHTLLGCKDVTVPTAPSTLPELGRVPFGALDSVTAASAAVDVSGWAIDPDTNQPISIHVYVDQRSIAATADLDRPDVGSVYPAYGPRHGYSTRVDAAPGQHNVCVYAINSGPGLHALLGCKAVTVQ